VPVDFKRVRVGKAARHGKAFVKAVGVEAVEERGRE
jgi:hypothetical protein